MHDGLWVLDQLTKADPNTTLRVWAMGKSNHKLLSHDAKCGALHDEWRNWLFAALSGANAKGGVVEFGFNPRTTKSKKGPMPPCLPLAVAVDFSVGLDYTLKERLEQVSLLSSVAFEPSLLIQDRECLYGIYLLDSPTDETTRCNLAAKINKLLHCQGWRRCAKPHCMLPLPGFISHGKRPGMVKLIHPIPIGSAKLYTITEFSNFPDAGKENQAEFYKRAATDPEGAKRFLTGLLEEARRLGDNRSVLAGAMINRAEARNVRLRRQLGVFQEPTRDTIPPIQALTALSYHGMTQTYVRKGLEIRREALRRLVHALFGKDLCVNIELNDAFVAVDERIISQLIELGYTYGAVRDFYRRKEHSCGIGKPDQYIYNIYAKEIKRLRAICPPKPEPAKNTPLLECVTAVCRMLPEFSQEERARIVCARGDALFLNAKATYRLYRAAQISQNLTPLASAEITNCIDHCQESYWLGCRMIDDHKMWGLSIKFIQSLGLLPKTSILKAV